MSYTPSYTHPTYTIPQRLLMAAARYGRKDPVIVDELGRALSYNHLIIGCAVLAQRIETLTQRPQIGCLLPNSVTGVATIIGCQFAHKTPAILNYTFPLPTLLRCCERAQLNVVLTSHQFLEKCGLATLPQHLASLGIQTIYLEDLAQKIGRLAKLRAALRVKLKQLKTQRSAPDDPAVILFTSGSEAEPKAVVLSHRNLLANCQQIFETFPIQSDEVLFSALPHFHAFGLTAGVLLPLLHGLKTVIGLSPLRHRENLQLIRKHRATVLLSTDTFLMQMHKVLSAGDLDTLRFVVAGAERLKPRTRALYETLGVTLLEGYGATEAGPVIAVNVPGASRDGTVGRILPHIEYRIEPHSGITEGGILHVRGPNLMTAYLHDLQAQQPSLDAGWYNTGDIVSIDSDGFLSIQGRKKRFTKIGGEMVSLGYVEDAIAQLSPDHTHAIIARESEALTKPRISLYTNDPALTLERLRSHFVQQKIPNICLPRDLIYLAVLPIHPTGKIDYQALEQRADAPTDQSRS